MSDNKKYYYLKFKEDYFEQDHIRVIEAIRPNGYIYSLILIKLYLKALKWDGQLRINEAVPYSKEKIDMLASVLNHDPDNVMHAINIAKDMGIVEILESGEIFMADMQSFIGHSSTEADRKRDYRIRMDKVKEMGQNGDKCPGLSDNRPPEIELELDPKKEIYIYSDKPSLLKSWNSHISGLIPKLNSISKSRYDKYKLRIQEGMDLNEIFKMIERSKFLKGYNKKNWKMTFDWLIENDKNYVKIMEGNYTDSDYYEKKNSKRVELSGKEVVEKMKRGEL